MVVLTKVDASTRIPVMSGDNRTGLDLSDDDGEDVKDEDEEENPASMAVVSTPDAMVPPTMMQHSHMQSHSESDTSYQSRNMPVRFHTQMEPQQTSFNEVSYLPRTVNFQPTSPTPQDPNRRSFASPGFHSPQQNMYGWGQQNTLVSNGPNTAYYVSSSQTLPQQSTSFQLPPPTSVSQPMLPPPLSQHHYELPTAPRFDHGPNLGLQVRTTSLGHPQHHGITEYYHDNNAYGHNDAEHQG